MFTAIKSLSIQTKPPVANLFNYTSNNFAGKAATPFIGTLRFQQQASTAEPADNSNNMDDKNQQPKETEKKGDVMSHSFGEGYATRSDEEGFGGIYGGNQSLSHEDEDKIVHGNSPDYDKSQGSEVKEKEKARHQTQANS